MADTLTEYAKLAGDEVSKGIIEEIITQDALMTRLKFKSFTGNAYIYNRELTLPNPRSTRKLLPLSPSAGNLASTCISRKPAATFRTRNRF